MKTKNLGRATKLNSRGFSHDILIVVFVVLFAIVGVGYLVATHASPMTDTSLDSLHTELPQYLPLPPGSPGVLKNNTNNTNITQTRSNPTWAGMVFLGGQAFTQAAGDVSVPYLHCQNSQSVVSIWVGLGGGTGSSSDSTVEQTGFYTGCNGASQTFRPFWEMFEAQHDHQGTINLKIRPGDKIHMQVVLNPPYFDFWLKNLTTNVSMYHRDKCYVTICSIQTTEWVFERPTLSDGSGSKYLLRLADFGTQRWSNTHWNVVGTLNPSAVIYRMVNIRDKNNTHYLAQVIPEPNTGINDYPIVWRYGD